MADYEAAIKRYEAALVFRRLAADTTGEANTLNNLGDAYNATGNYQEASLNYGMALQLAKQSFDFRNQFRAIDGLVASSSSLGRYSRAFQLLDERLKLAWEQESRRQELVTLRSFARLYLQVEEYPKARSFYRQAVRQGWRSGGWERGSCVAQRVESNSVSG